jgi:hypothetical protein
MWKIVLPFHDHIVKSKAFPGFLGTVPEMRHVQTLNIFYIFPRLSLLLLYYVLLITVFRLETFFDFVSDFPEEELATVLRTDQ